VASSFGNYNGFCCIDQWTEAVARWHRPLVGLRREQKSTHGPEQERLKEAKKESGFRSSVHILTKKKRTDNALVSRGQSDCALLESPMISSSSTTGSQERNRQLLGIRKADCALCGHIAEKREKLWSNSGAKKQDLTLPERSLIAMDGDLHTIRRDSLFIEKLDGKASTSLAVALAGKTLGYPPRLRSRYCELGMLKLSGVPTA